MNCVVCKNNIDEALIYSHNNEGIVTCSKKCRVIAENHECKRYCRLLVHCNKCKDQKIKHCCIKVGALFYCEYCRSGMKRYKPHKKHKPRIKKKTDIFLFFR